MNHCRLCHLPIRKLPGHESRPDNEACWTHVSGGFICPTVRPGAGSEFEVATFDPDEARRELRDDLLEETPPEDYCI